MSSPWTTAASGPVDRARWGVLAPTFDPYGLGTPPLLDGVRRAEALGFDSAWVGDHLAFHPPLLESICSLAAASSVTSRITLGLGVLLLPLRHLVWTAKQLTTLQALAPDRLAVGVGIGGENPSEYASAGVPIGQRGRRLDEALHVLPDLLTGQPVDHHGPLLPVHTVGLRPAAAVAPPIVVGGRSDVAIARAARHADAWIGLWVSAKTAGQRAEELATRAVELGREPPAVIMMVITNVDPDAERAREQAAGLMWGQYRLPYHVVERWTATGPPEQVAEFLLDYRNAGVSELILLPASPDPVGQFERFAEVRELVEQQVTVAD